MLSFLSPYKNLIIGIAIALVVGYIAILNMRISSYKTDVIGYKSEIKELKSDNAKLTKTNNDNSAQFEIDIKALKDQIERIEKNAKNKLDTVKEQLELCLKTKCIDAVPGNTNGAVKILDDKSSKEHVDFYNGIIRKFNSRK